MSRKPKCKSQNYNCGKICISGRYICRVDGLKGQSVSIANKLVDLIENKKGKAIKEGEFEKVYTNDKGESFREENIRDNLNRFVKPPEPVLKHIIKKKIEQREISKKQIDSLDIDQYFPKILEITSNKNGIKTKLEEIEGHLPLSSSTEKPSQELIGEMKEEFLKKGVVHNKLYLDNVYYNPKTESLKILDIDNIEQRNDLEEDFHNESWKQIDIGLFGTDREKSDLEAELEKERGRIFDELRD